MFAELGAGLEVLLGGIEIVAFTEQLAHADVHVRHAPQHQRRLLGRNVQSPPVGAHRLAKAALHDQDVRQGEGKTECVREVPRLLQARERFGVPAVGGVEIALVPVRQREQGGGRATPEVIVLSGELERSAGVGDGARRRRRAVALFRPGRRRSGWGDGGTARGRGRPSQSACRRLGPAPPSPPASARCPGAVLPPLRCRRLTICEATSAMASTGLTRNSSSGSASSQRRNVASCRARNAGIAAISMRSAARSKSSPSNAWPIAAGWSPLRAYQSLARRCSSWSWSCCSSSSRARSTSAKRWW